MTLVKVHPLCVLVWWHDRPAAGVGPGGWLGLYTV